MVRVIGGLCKYNGCVNGSTMFVGDTGYCEEHYYELRRLLQEMDRQKRKRFIFK